MSHDEVAPKSRTGAKVTKKGAQVFQGSKTAASWSSIRKET